MFTNGAEFLSCLMKSVFSSVSSKSRGISSLSIFLLVKSSDDGVPSNDEFANADAEVNDSKRCRNLKLFNEIHFCIRLK